LTSPSIEAVNLSKAYGSFTALSNLNLKIEGPKCVGFLGPNGAGKTTTLKLFTDLISATQGEALINGVNVHKDKKRALASCSTLVETPEIYPSLTPKEALMMIAEMRGVPREERRKRIEETISEVKMEEWTDKRVGKFSKGMKQRINIAAAILSNPEILLLDEPTAGLDPRGMSEVRDIVKSLKNRGRLIFMSSHLLGEVSDICDEVAMIDHGKLIVYDTITNVTTRFSGGGNLVEVGLLGPVNTELTSRVSSIPGVVSVEAVDDKNLKIRIVGDLKVQAKILSGLAALEIGMISFRSTSSALEDVYLKLITETL
jgi:ABC-2 type transport system ATP-binding protein